MGTEINFAGPRKHNEQRHFGKEYTRRWKQLKNANRRRRLQLGIRETEPYFGNSLFQELKTKYDNARCGRPFYELEVYRSENWICCWSRFTWNKPAVIVRANSILCLSLVVRAGIMELTISFKSNFLKPSSFAAEIVKSFLSLRSLTLEAYAKGTNNVLMMTR